jgi:hypothetical protein
VAAEPVADPQGPLEVHGIARSQSAERRAVERLDLRVGRPPVVAELDDGEAAPVHRDRVADLRVAEDVGARDLEARAAVGVGDGT